MKLDFQPSFLLTSVVIIIAGRQDIAPILNLFLLMVLLAISLPPILAKRNSPCAWIVGRE